MKQISKNGFFQDIYNNWPYFLLLVLILLSPRFTLFQLTATRNFDLRIEDLFIAGLAILAFFQLLKKRISVIPKIPGLWMIGVYVTVALVSTLAGTFNHTLDPLKSWFYYLKEIEYFILFLFIAAWKDARSHVSTIIGIIAGAVIINAIYSWIMFIVFHAAGPDNGRYTILGLVEISKFPLGAFYYIISIMVLGELFFGDKTSKVLKALFITAFVFSTFSCLFIISRASIVMMMVSFSILMMYYLKFESKKALFIIPLIAVFFAIIFVVMLVFFKDKIPIFAYMKSSSSITARISEVWAPVLQCLFHGDFLFGLGKGFSGLRNFDSLYVKVMVETGFVGTFFFFAFLTFFMINLLKKRVDSPDLKKVRITYIAIFGGMLVGGIFSETMFIVKVGELFWFFSGLTFATFNGLPRNDPSNSSGPGIFKRVAKCVYYSVYV